MKHICIVFGSARTIR